METELKAFLICRDVLTNSRNPSVISIINIINQLQVSSFPANVENICVVALYGGVSGQYTHRVDILERDEKVGETPEHIFFLEDRNELFHAVSYIDGFTVEEPRHLVFRAVLNGEVKGEATLGIFRPLPVQ